jgi:hypothetical protein
MISQRLKPKPTDEWISSKMTLTIVCSVLTSQIHSSQVFKKWRISICRSRSDRSRSTNKGSSWWYTQYLTRAKLYRLDQISSDVLTSLVAKITNSITLCYHSIGDLTSDMMEGELVNRILNSRRDLTAQLHLVREEIQSWQSQILISKSTFIAMTHQKMLCIKRSFLNDYW